ncbi:OmpA family protein [Psychroflexus planctonicus]|uniref:Cell envelope biogenesis protein OmpA n=1 Tax=Psychroflexus planctonicus TaxID=1526575 RepID=A0ABQ1SCQ7_9FLAO|nr:OmpA family protein [Psychroflexus planctonicus]GGE26985.1 cell envelope biogenesis protein OmpA [Psychroflexus planctonicus]
MASCSFSSAQNWYLDKANDDYKNGAYVDVLDIFEGVIRKGYSNESILKKTANAYYFQAEYRMAYSKYRLLFRKYKNLSPEIYLRYMHCMKSVSRYDEAEELMQKFTANLPDEEQNEIFNLRENYLEAIEAKKDDYDIGITAINSLEADFAPTYFKNKVVFTSARDTGNLVKHRHKWNDSPFTKFYVATMHPRTKELSKVEAFAKKINTSNYHESSTAFTKDGKTMYFTRNNFHQKNKTTDKKGVQLLKVYRAFYVDGKWQNVEDLAFNDDEFNTAHPALSPDEKYLYFVSDRPGGYGKSDLWKVEILNDGNFSEPENLGDKINTSERETFPFIAYNNLLYFASNGHLGLGGLDIFVTQSDSLGKYNKVLNLGSAVNSKFDDFAMIIDSSDTGFFSSSRNIGRYQKDNIFRIKQHSKPDFDDEKKKKIKIIDEETKKSIANTKVRVFDQDYNQINSSEANEVGRIKIKQPEAVTSIYVRFEKEGYEVKEISLKLEDFSNFESIEIELRKRLQEIKKGKDLAVVLQIEEIYFDLDKYVIRQDAAAELAKVLEIMKAYPDISIEIGSHTDNRASKAYNNKLSQNRADATRNWLIEKGISKDRISAKGYGESQLVNKCKDGVDCTEEEHQQNRRSEFIIVEMKD